MCSKKQERNEGILDFWSKDNILTFFICIPNALCIFFCINNNPLCNILSLYFHIFYNNEKDLNIKYDQPIIKKYLRSHVIFSFLENWFKTISNIFNIKQWCAFPFGCLFFFFFYLLQLSDYIFIIFKTVSFSTSYK